MRTRGPMLTLLAVLTVGLAVFAANAVVTARHGQPAVTTTAQSGSTGSGAPAATPTPQAASPAPPRTQTAPLAPEAAAPPPQQAISDAVFAGRSAGNEVTVAMGVEGDKVVAYVCDGKKVESWFEGTFNGGKLQLSGVDGDLTADATKQAVFGTVAVGDKSWPFSAEPAKAPAGSATDRAVLKKLRTA